MRRSPSPSTVSQAICVFVRHAREQGAVAVLSRFGVPPEIGDAREARVSLRTLRELPEALAMELAEPNLGLVLGQRIPRGVYRAFEAVTRAPPTVARACERFVRYNRLLDTTVRFTLREDVESVALWHDVPGDPEGVGRHTSELVLVMITRFLRAALGPAFTPLAVTFAHPRPADTRIHEAFFGSPAARMVFGSSGNSVAFPRALLDRAIGPGDRLPVSGDRERDAEEAAGLLSRVPSLAVADDPWMSRVREALVAGFADGTPAVEEIARALATSTRTLQRRLGEAGFTFSTLTDALRQELAHALMIDPTRSLGDIAFLLGFSEISAFTRAYKRWTGRTPSEARRSRAL